MKIRGIDIILHEKEDLSNYIRKTEDFFEPDILDYIAEYHKEQRVILDIGANIGNHSIFFANFLNYESIICFEPIPKNFELLVQNMISYNNIGLVNKAVSATTHENLGMLENKLNMGNGRVHLDGDIRVSAVSIDKLALNDITLMKIDVEGHEPAVLAGAQETIFRCHPDILIEDWNKEYAQLLPSYKIEKGWDHHRTYLYTWDTYKGVYEGYRA